MSASHISNFRRTFRTLASITFLAVSLSAAPIQSPIDIRSENTLFTTLPALQFAYSSNTPIQVTNNGSPGNEATIKSLVPVGAGNLTVDGTIWPLLQFHFHTESEHQLNGTDYDMEMHLVHQLSSGEYLVVGRFISIGANNSVLDPIFSNLPPDAANPVDLASFDLGGLLPSDLTSHRYTGSLTTSPYTEGVNWVMLAEILELSASQVDAFRALFPAGNEREVQALSDRVILTDVEGFASIPEPSTAFLVGAGAVVLIVRRIRYRRS